MSATELDLPLLPSSDQIRRREFASIRRGYDPDQVREYLQQIAAQLETLERELREARLVAASQERVVAVPQPAEDRYDELARRLSELIRSADAEAQRIVEEARDEAGRTVGEARTEADRIRVDAQARAEEARQEGHEFLEHARLEAERALSGLSARRETLVQQLQEMQSRLLGVARELETAIDDRADGKESSETAETARAVPAPVDPRYEDLFASDDSIAMNLDDIGPIDLSEGDEPRHE